MTTITVLAPLHVRTPRVTRLAATVFLAVLRTVQRAAAGRAESRLVASRIREAAAVREYAQRFRNDDPRFASDLLAAADRHDSI